MTVERVASFPGLPQLQKTEGGGRRPGESYHVIRGTGVTCRHAYIYSHAREKTDLGFCASYEDETSADGEQCQAYKTYPSYNK